MKLDGKLNEERIEEILGVYSSKLRKVFLEMLGGNGSRSLGLDYGQEAALISYFGFSKTKNACVSSNPAMEDPTLFKGLMNAIKKQKYLVEIADLERNFEKMVPIDEQERLKVVAGHTTGQLMEMYGLYAYPLLMRCAEHEVYPLPDLSPNGSIRPYLDVLTMKLDPHMRHMINALYRASCGCRYSNGIFLNGATRNIVTLIMMDESKLKEIRCIGAKCLNKIKEMREKATQRYPLQYGMLVDLIRNGKIPLESMSYYLTGSCEAFEEFKHECELRSLIKFDDPDSLRHVEFCTCSELKNIFGDSFETLIKRCEYNGIYPLPELGLDGSISQKYPISCISSDKVRDVCIKAGYKFTYQLFEIFPEECASFLASLSDDDRREVYDFMETVEKRYPEHVSKLRELKQQSLNANKRYTYDK